MGIACRKARVSNGSGLDNTLILSSEGFSEGSWLVVFKKYTTHFARAPIPVSLNSEVLSHLLAWPCPKISAKVYSMRQKFVASLHEKPMATDSAPYTRLKLPVSHYRRA